MTKTQLQKLCIGCGMQKPLAAFLQLSGSEGSLYGNVCSTCRGSGAKKNEKITLTEEGASTSSSGLRIDADARTQANLQEKKHLSDKEEKKRVDRLEKENLISEKTERLDLQQKMEKDHRHYLAEKKKPGFLRFQENKKTPIKTGFPESEQPLSDLQKTEALKEEQRITSTDLTVPTLGLRTDEVRHQSAVFQGFQAFLGKSAPIVKAMNVIEKLTNKSPEKTTEKTETPSKEAPTHHVNQSWRKR